jgi:hypothetical protein
LLLLVCLAIYLLALAPGEQGPWRKDHERPMFAELSGRSVTIHNIRNFRYDDDRQVTSAEYLSKSWPLDDLEQIWFGLSHFGPVGLAHSFLSAKFRDGSYLSISIEARLRPGQGYNPLLGLFRQYTKIYIAGTEQDIIGLRSHLRSEKVLLYPVRNTRESREQYFLSVINDANDLSEAPAFYNTILDNCLTNLLRHSARLSEISASDLRVLLPGLTDGLTYAFGITPDDIPFEEARQRALVDPSRGSIDQPGFSSTIRCGWSGYAGRDIPACQ